MSWSREVISSFVALEILIGSTCKKLHSELHLPLHWNGMQRATWRGLSVLWCENFGQPCLVFSGNLTGLRKSPYLLPAGTFHLPNTLALDSGFCAGLLTERRHSFFFHHFGHCFSYYFGFRGRHGGGSYWTDRR